MDRLAEITLSIATKTVIGISLFFNIFGIYLLKTINRSKSTQIEIIVSLSAADIYHSIGYISKLVVDTNFPKQSKANSIIWTTRAGVYHIWYAMHYLLTIDRFFGCNFPLQYRARISLKKVRKILVISWAISILLGILYCLFDIKKIKSFYDEYFWLANDVIFLALFVLTYSTIFYRKIKRNKMFGQRETISENRQFLIVTTAILLAFLMLEIIPSQVILNLDMPIELKYEITALLWNLNVLADPLIYIFLQPRFRIATMKKARRIFGLNRKVFHLKQGSSSGLRQQTSEV